MSVSKNTIKKIGHRACLGYMTGQTCPIYACTSINHARHFIGSRCILLQLEATVFEEPLEKILIGRESRAYGTIWYIIAGKSHKVNRHRHKTFLESFLSSSQFVTSFEHSFNFIFFSLRRFFFEFPQGGLLQSHATKNMGHRPCSRAEDHRTSLPGPWIENNTVFSECARARSYNFMIFMLNTGCVEQYWGITLRWSFERKSFVRALRSDYRKVSFRNSINDGQFNTALSTQLMKPNYLVKSLTEAALRFLKKLTPFNAR